MTRRSQIAVELGRGTAAIPLSLSEHQVHQLQIFVSTLLLWRQRLNLTGAATALDLLRYHIVDSLYVAPLVPRCAVLVDLGSGAGFPGIPLAIARPDLHVILVESRRKRANFLRDAVRQTGLANGEVVEMRAEEMLNGSPRQFDAVTSRAVWPLRAFLRIAVRFLKRGGLAIAMRAPTTPAEIVDGFEPPDVVAYELWGNVSHVLLAYRKR